MTLGVPANMGTLMYPVPFTVSVVQVSTSVMFVPGSKPCPEIGREKYSAVSPLLFKIVMTWVPSKPLRMARECISW